MDLEELEILQRGILLLQILLRPSLFLVVVVAELAMQLQQLRLQPVDLEGIRLLRRLLDNQD
jgi:hypothetical protein